MELKPADAIVVLGAAVWAGGKPSPTLERRTRHAVAFHQRGLAPLIILSGGLGLHPPTEAEAMAAICKDASVPDDVLLLEDCSTSTFDNVQFSADLLWQRDANSVIVVTDRFHMPRAAMCFRYLGFETQTSASPSSNFPGSRWRRLRAWAREILALPYYRVMLSKRLQQRASEKS